MIIETKTGKAELCFVKVHGNSFNYVVRQMEGLSDLWYESHYGDSDISNWIELPPVNWQIVGNPFELSEGQCKGLAVRSDRHPDLELYIDHTADSTRYAYLLKSAKASFNSLLNHLKIYQTNPFPDPELTMRQGDGYVYYGASDEEFAEYEEAEERTGSFIMLKKIV